MRVHANTAIFESITTALPCGIFVVVATRIPMMLSIPPIRFGSTDCRM
jgi:hypothetical protein